MNLLLKRINLVFITILFATVTTISASADTLSSMVESVLEGHEDVVNSKKELEEASRDVTDALLVYAPDCVGRIYIYQLSTQQTLIRSRAPFALCFSPRPLTMATQPPTPRRTTATSEC